MEATMESKTNLTMERLEQKLLGWEKMLYASFSAAIIMLAQAFVKAYENQLFVNVFFSMEKDFDLSSLSIFNQYNAEIFRGLISPWRTWLWLLLEFAILAPAALLAFHPTWRKIALSKRLDLVFGYLLAGWIALLSLGAQDPLNASDGYNVFVIVYLLALGLSYWQLRRKKDKAEEVFP
jgi:hypothetical protein